MPCPSGPCYGGLAPCAHGTGHKAVGEVAGSVIGRGRVVRMEPASGSALTKLRGLPYNTTETEITEFFEGFQTTLVHICRRDGDRLPPESMSKS